MSGYSRLRAGLWTAAAAAVLAGCRPGGEGRGETGGPPPKTGPSIERLVSQFSGPELSPAAKEAYWRRVEDTLVSATGEVAAVDARIILETRLKKTGQRIYVAAYPAEHLREALPSLRPGQPLGVQGNLTERHPDPLRSTVDRPAFVLRNARIKIK